MKRTLIKVVVVILFGITTNAFSADETQSCDVDVVKIVGMFLKLNNVFGYKNSSSEGVIVAMACKLSPQNKNIVIASFVYDLFDESHPAREGEKELIVTLVNVKTKQVISNYQETIFEDSLTGVGESSLKIDTARYYLNKNTRAFGLIFNSSAHGANCADNNWGNELNLFVQKGNSLQKILSFPMQFTHFVRGCPAVMNPDDIEVKFAFLTIDVQKTSNNGFADLLLTAHINDGDAQDLKPKPTDERCMLRYDGKFYVKDKKFRSWWMLESW